MKIKSPIGFLALWSAFLAAGTWIVPFAAFVVSPPRAIASVAPSSVEAEDTLKVTGEYVLNREGDITEADLVRVHTSTFKALFDEDWDPNNWAYPLSERVNGPGRYTGRNHLNLDYAVTVAQWTPLSLDTVAMSAEQRELLRTAGVSAASVMVVLSTAKARVHMFGVVCSRRSPQGGLGWWFMPTYFADPGHPLYSDVTIALDQGTVDSQEGFREEGPPAPVPASTRECILAAVEAYNAAVAACTATHNAAVHACNVTHSIAIAGCNSTYNAAVAAAVGTFHDCVRDALALEVLCLVACGLAGGASGGVGLFFCASGCLAVLTWHQTGCATTMATALQTAQTARTNCIGPATVARKNCLLGASTAYDACITQAMTDCAAAVALCP